MIALVGEADARVEIPADQQDICLRAVSIAWRTAAK